MDLLGSLEHGFGSAQQTPGIVFGNGKGNIKDKRRERKSTSTSGKGKADDCRKRISGACIYTRKPAWHDPRIARDARMRCGDHQNRLDLASGRLATCRARKLGLPVMSEKILRPWTWNGPALSMSAAELSAVEEEEKNEKEATSEDAGRHMVVCHAARPAGTILTSGVATAPDKPDIPGRGQWGFGRGQPWSCG
ncbi:hypothetical protein VTK56DRAFT_2443 [Thermocarpiscus australiensis]